MTRKKSNQSPAADLNFIITIVILINLLFTLLNHSNHCQNFEKVLKVYSAKHESNQRHLLTQYQTHWKSSIAPYWWVLAWLGCPKSWLGITEKSILLQWYCIYMELCKDKWTHLFRGDGLQRNPLWYPIHQERRHYQYPTKATLNHSDSEINRQWNEHSSFILLRPLQVTLAFKCKL